MHYFHNPSLVSGGFATRPLPGFHWGTFVRIPLICSPLETNGAGADEPTQLKQWTW